MTTISNKQQYVCDVAVKESGVEELFVTLILDAYHYEEAKYAGVASYKSRWINLIHTAMSDVKAEVVKRAKPTRWNPLGHLPLGLTPFVEKS